MRLSLVNSLQTPPGRHGLLIGENSWLSKCCFHLTLIFLTLIFVGFRPSKIHMALSLKTRNFNFGDPTTPRTPSSSSSTSSNAALACSTGGGVGRGAFQARVRPLGQNRGASSASSMAVRTNGNVRRVPHAGALDAQPPALIRADTERSQALVSRVKKRKFGGAGACALQFALSAAQQSAASAGFLAAAAASVSEQQLLQ